MKHLILVTGGFCEGELSEHRACGRLYADCLLAAGAQPVLYMGGAVDPSRFDGLLLSGGGDVDPSFSGQPEDPRIGGVDKRRDEEELALIRAFAAQKKPTLGICRGIQILNVAFGGALHPHLDGHEGTPHRIDTQRGSLLEQLCGSRLLANSYHHQGVLTLAPGLKATARAADGLIEGVEHAELPIVGVQWHPERMVRGLCTDTADDMSALFEWLTKF